MIMSKTHLPCAASTLLLLILNLLIGCEKNREPVMDETILDGMVRIPAGEFTMGSNEVDAGMLQQRFGMRDTPYQDENPERKVRLGEYYIDRYEVTNRHYRALLDDVRDILPDMSYVFMMPRPQGSPAYPVSKDDLPVVWVSWHNANTYCAWKGKRLPSEAEWEKAARGGDGRIFPWGNEFDEKKTNSRGFSGGVAPVGRYKGDLSPYDVYDMAGNVSEWVDDWYRSYPGNKFQSESYGEKHKVIRGGSWGGIGHYILEMFYRAPRRAHMPPDQVLQAVGFRCAYSK